MFGTAWRSLASRSQGSSERKRRDTSYVAPPHASRLHRFGVVRATCPATESRSRVRTRVASSDWCASRKVVSVTATASCARPPGELLRADREQQLPGAVGGGHLQVHGRQLGDRVDGDRRGAVRAVDGDVREVVEQLGAAVRGAARGEQLRVVLDERGVQPAGPEVRVVEHRLEERDVRGDAADPELGDRPPGPLDRGGEVPAAAGELGQHRVEVRADLGARVGGAAVEPHARAAGGAVGGDLAGVGTEAVRGVLGGDPALERRAVRHDPVLAEAEVGQGLAGRDPQLGLDQVDVGDLLGHRVLDLDPRVHLDEHVAAVGVEQELHGAGVAVADLLREPDRVGAHALAQLRVEVRRRGDLHDLLVAALHRAVPLVEVDHLALAVGEDLHLDVAGVDHGLLDEHGGVAEGASASRMQVSTASRRSFGSSTRRIPRPPPPATAFTKSG